MIILNIWNFCFIKNYVVSVDAEIDMPVKADELLIMKKKWKKKRESRKSYWSEKIRVPTNKGSGLSVAEHLNEQ